MLIRENWPELLVPKLRYIFDVHKKDLKDYLPTLYNVEGSKKAQEFALGAGSLGLMKEWTESDNQVYYEDLHKGFLATYSHKKYSLGIKIERELLEDDLYSEIKKRTKKLSRSVYYTRQYHAALPFNNAFSGLMLGPDNKPLCAADHPLSPSNANTWSNVDELKFNADNVEAVRNLMKSWTDDKGNLLAINPDTLIVPKQLRKAALVIADSAGEPDTDKNNINIWRGSLNVIEHDFLSDSRAWFMVDMLRMKDFLNWYDRRKAKLEMESNFDSEAAKYKVVERFSYGWDDASFIFGCQEPVGE